LKSAKLLLIRLITVSFAELLDATPGFPFVVVRQPFEEQQRQDVSLVILNLAAKSGVGNSPEEAAELLFRKRHRLNPVGN